MMMKMHPNKKKRDSNMKSKKAILAVFTLSLCFASAAQASNRKPFNYLECEFNDGGDSSMYKCAATVVTCVPGGGINWGAECKPQFEVFCDDGEMFLGDFREGYYDKYMRIEGRMEEASYVRPNTVLGPLLDCVKDPGKGYPSNLQIYGKTMSGYCSMHYEYDAWVPGTQNP